MYVVKRFAVLSLEVDFSTVQKITSYATDLTSLYKKKALKTFVTVARMVTSNIYFKKI